MSKPICVALVEDHAATREGLARELAEASQHISSVLAVPDGETLLASPRLGEVDVALVDLRLPGLTGAQTITRLGEVAPRVRAVVLTAIDESKSVFEVIASGAVGYLLKSEPFERLLSAVLEAADRQHPFSSRVAGYLLTQLRPAAAPELSPREKELAAALAEGLSYADCASRLGIALGTVQHHVKNLYRKLDVNSKQEVRSWVQRHAPSL